MRTPVHAILWELWRLTRVEACWHLALGVVAASAVLALVDGVAPNQAVKDIGAVIALMLLVLPHMAGWVSINKLNLDRPGFPLYLLYTRPVRTEVAVGVAMAYWATVPAASYLASALLLRNVFGHAFPLVIAAAWIASVNLAGAAVNWSIRRPVVRTLGHAAVGGILTFMAMGHLRVETPGPNVAPPRLWPTVFDVPLTVYALLAAIGLASFGLTVAAVARQRRGDGRAALAWTPGNGFPDRLVGLFRFACPISSATRAQVWYELRSRGLPLLTIGVALALVNTLLFAAGNRIDAVLFDGLREHVRLLAVVFAGLSVLAVVGLGGNAFGIRWRPGRRYVSAFDAAQPYETAWLAGVKVLVRSMCVLAACIAVGVSVWASGALIAFGELSGGSLDHWQRAVGGAMRALTGYQWLALAVVACVGVVSWVSSWAACGALATRYPRRFGIAWSLLLLYGFALILLALGDQREAEVAILGAILRATSWVAASAMVLATGYLLWRALAERLLTPRWASGAVLVSAAFGAAWLTMLRAAGVQLGAMPATEAFWMLLPALLPLAASALAPWSLSRIRHT